MSVHSGWKRGLSFLVTVSMVLSLVPSPALAEAMEEMSGSNGSAVQGGGSQAPMIEQPEGQVTGQSQGQGASGEAPVSDTPVGGETKPAEREQAKGGGETHSTSGVGLTVQGDGDGQSNHEYTPLTLGVSVNYSLANDDILRVSFTAPETGVYDFTAHCTSGAPAHFTIYDSDEFEFTSDNAISPELNGGAEKPVVITRYMNKDDRFLLSVTSDDGEQTQGSVIVQTSSHDVHDLAIADLQLEHYSFTLPNDTISFDATVRDCTGQLVDPDYYDLVFYTHGDYGDMVLCDGVPNGVGDYYVSAKAKNENAGGYSGQTANNTVYVTINDPTNLASPWWNVEFVDAGGNANDIFETQYTGAPIRIPQVKVWRNGDNGEEITLTQGTDFAVMVDGDVESIKDVGWYTLHVHGTGTCSGTNWKTLGVSVTPDNNNLSLGHLYLAREGYAASRLDLLAQESNVVTYDGSQLSSDQYALVYYVSSDAQNPLAEAPVEPGTYWVAARAKNESGYTGETPRVQLEVYAENSIADSSAWQAGFESGSSIVYTGSPVVLPALSITRYDGSTGEFVSLEENKDFRFVRYESQEHDPLDGAPTDPGFYCAAYEGIGGYSGVCHVQFEIADPNDIGSGYWNCEMTKYGYTGNPVALTKSQLYRYDENSQKVYLQEGADYRIVAYYSDDDPEVSLQGAPSEIGSYRVRYEGVSPYTGTRDVQFEIVDISNLGQGSIDLARTTFAVGDNLSAAVTVKNSAGDVLVEGTDYDLVFYESDGVTLATPSAEGDYMVAASGRGSTYTGETTPAYFNLYALPEGIVSIENNGSYTATITNEYDSWIGRFIAPATAAYEFFTQGDESTRGGLYGDPWGNEQLNYATRDGEDPNFRMVQYLEAGQSAYLFVANGDYSASNAVQTTVCVRTADNTNLANGSIRINEYSEYEYTGSPIEPKVLVYDSMQNQLTKGVDYELVYYEHTELDSGEYGYRELKGAPTDGGFYQVAARAKAENAAGYTGTTETMSFRINDPWSISFNAYCQIAGKDFQNEDKSVPGVFYTGEALNPQVSVRSNETGSDLVEGTDYTVTYDNNTNVTADGEFATATIRGTGQYHGTEVLRFVIADPHDLQAYVWAAGGKLTAGDTERLFGQDKAFPMFRATGSPVEPIVAVNQFANTPAPVEESDFTVTYEESEYGHGEYFAVLTAKQGSPFTGVAKVWYGVQPILSLYAVNATPRLNGVPAANVSIETHGRDEWVYTINGYEGSLTGLSWDLDSDDGTLVKDTDYALSVGEDEFGSGDVRYCFEGINDGGASGYRGQVYAYVRRGNATNIADAVVSDIASQTYTGAAIMPELTVTYGGNELQKGVDYEVVYQDNTNVGTATVTITGKGDCYGTKTATFQIDPATITASNVFGVAESATFAGSPITMPVDVIVNGTTLQLQDLSDPTKGDYTIAYENNVNAGTATVTITGKNNYAGTVTKNFTINPVAIDSNAVALTGVEDKEFTGSAIEQDGLTLTLGDYTLVKNTDYTVAYSNNTSKGEATITITAAGTNFTGSRTATFNITGKVLSDENATVSAIEPVTYDGTPKTPEPTVTLKEGGMVLQKGTDYDLSYDSNTNAGIAIVKITGKGDFGSTLTREFTINPAPITSVEDIAARTYTGSVIEPELVVRAGELTLGQGEYTVAYADNTNAGTATVTVTGVNNYAGNVTKSFTINPVAIDSDEVALAGVTDKEYTGSSIEQDGLSLTLDDYTLVKDTDYTVSYLNNTSAGEATVTITAAGTNFTGSRTARFNISPVTITASMIGDIADQTYTGGSIEPALVISFGDQTLTAGTDYTVSYSNNVNIGAAAKATVNGTGNFTGSADKTFVINAAQITLVDAIEPHTYTGNPITPTLVVKSGDRTLTGGDDYDVVYSNNTNAGTATVTITGKGGYTGSVTKEFTINPVAIDSDAVTLAGMTNKEYTGSAIVQDGLTLTLGDYPLVKDKDYTVAYANNVDAGTATVTVVGTGNFAGALSKGFTITPAAITSVSVTGNPTYTGEPITPDLEVKAGELTLGQDDYVATFSNNINAGSYSASVSVTASGNFSGTLSDTFTIQKRDIGNATIDAFPDQVYTGSPLTPELTLFDNGRTLVKGVDYEIAYENNTNVTAEGEFASITITGKGNYTGTKPSGFTIAPMSIARATVTADAQTYTGGALTPGVTVKLGGTTLSASDYDVAYADNVDAGTATVTVAGKGNYTDTATGTFQIRPASIADATISPIGAQDFTGKAIKPEVAVTLGGTGLDPANYTVSYANNVKAGTATVTVSGRGNYTDTASLGFTINKVAINSDAVIVSGIADKTANGSEQTQDALTLKLGDYTLTSDDYTVEYANNVAAGEATITIKATEGGNFSGTRTETFHITQLTMGEVAAATYTGEAITPKPAIKNGETALVEGTDFEYDYEHNTDAGTATVIARGKGAYDGVNMSAQFTISPAAITEVSVTGNATYDGTAKMLEPTVKAGEKTLAKDTDYTVEYRNNVNAGDASVIVTGKGNYGGTRGTTFAIAGASIDGATIEPIADQTYTGKEIKPAVAVSLADKTLVEGTDYTVTYARNKNAGTATVAVVGAGNYTGENSVEFSIAKRDLGSAQISAISDQIYTGDAIEPAFGVVLDGKTLYKDTDYTVEYENNVNAGEEAKVIVTGTGNYSGSAARPFTIKALNLSDATIEGLDSYDEDGKAKFVYSDERIQPTVTVSLGGKTLVEDRDYMLTYQNNLGAGQATATIGAIDANPNYIGKSIVPFTIVPAEITEVTIDGDTTDFAYTGAAITPELVVKAGGLTLGADDYAVTYLNNVNAGGATATVTGKGNYAGTASVAFTIGAASAEGLFIDAIADQTYAGGSDIKPSLTVKFNGETVDAQSYDVAYANNTGVGVATATVTPEAGSNFTGSRTVMFNIKPATIDNVSGVSSTVAYTGEPITFNNLTVKAGDLMLGASDYTATYTNNLNAGKAKLTLAAKGNYAGGGSFEFQITPKSLATGYTVELPKNADGTDVIYSETAGLDVFEPVPVVKDKDANGKVLDPSNYDVTYLNNAVAGEARVIVTGKGNYKDSPADAMFTIYKYAGTAASGGENTVVWHVEGDGAMTIEPRKKDEDATLSSASNLTWSQAVADYTTSVSVDSNVKNCTDTSGMFSGLTNVTSVDIEEFDTSGVTNMSGMFQGCESLTADGITGTLNTSNVTDMSNMFAGCTSLESIDFASPVQQQSLLQTMGQMLLGTQTNEGFDTSKVTNMSRMFEGCTSLTGEGIKDRLNTGSVVNMSNMFAGCTGLTDLDMEGIDTTNVTDMSGMFKGCTGLRTLNIKSFDTGAVNNMAGMYDGCALKQFTIGANYMNAAITEALPEPSSSTGMWWATNAQVWRSNDTIRSLGAQVADTYSNTGLLSSASTSIASANIEAATTNPYIYNGGEYRPSVDGVTIGQGQDKISLVAGIDYEVGYEDNQNAGTARVIVTGLGDYSASANREFSIQPKSLEDNSIEVTAPSNATYNGSEHKSKPTVKSTADPDATLVEDTDYTLSYSDNVNVGTATVVVTGKGNYAGTRSTTFGIDKAQSTLAARAIDGTVSYERSTSKDVCVERSNVSVTGAAGRVTYENASTDATAAGFSVGAGTCFVTVPKGTPVGTYQLRIRVTDAGDANHEGGTVEAEYTVKVTAPGVTPATTTRDGLDWSAVYDPAYYAEQNPDVANWAKRADGTIDGDRLLQHFVNNGEKEGRRSKDSFELASYYNANADLRRAFGTSDWSKYYRHYVTNGARENRTCEGVGELRGYMTSRDGVNWAPVYDANYYAQQNGDVANWARRSFNSGSVFDDAALLQHFVNSGAKEGRRSKDGFDLASYFNANADLRAAFGGTADLSKYYRHYATNGSRENRACSGVGELRGAVTSRDGVDWSPVYDRAYYAQKNGDVATWATRKAGAFGTVVDDYALLQHFVGNGAKEGRRSKDGFELTSYYNANADLRRAFGTDWARYYRHYATNGARERRTCSGVGQLRGFATSSGGVDWAPVYDANEYASRNADLARWATRSFNSGSVLDDAALLSHFVNNGQKERRQAKSTFNVTNYRNRYADLNRAFGDNWPSYYRHFCTNGHKENRNGA